MDGAYALAVEEVQQELQTDAKKGLSAEGVRRSREKYGRNELPPPEGTSFWRLVLKQFEDLLVLILLGAAVISFVLGFLEENESFWSAFVEPAVILLILIANAIVGVVQESNAEQAIERLKEYEAHTAKVIREGKAETIERADLVPGDLVRVARGDKVPADCRLVSVSSSAFSVDESMLTGESVPVAKHINVIKKDNPVNQDKKNMLFAGALVVKGSCDAIVVQTGATTELGKIQNTLREKDDEERTPLQMKLDVFANQLTWAIGFICLFVWVINIGHFTDPEHGSLLRGAIYYFKIAVALAVAAIPEGLPAVVTTCLALGTMKMASKNAIVRSLPSVETLGCTTIICTDKTGTVTTNKMSVRHVMVIGGVDERDGLLVKQFEVEGTDFSPFGAINAEHSSKPLDLPANDHALEIVGRVCTLCNECNLTYNKDKEVFGLQGDSTEGALTVLAEKIGIPDKFKWSKVTGSNRPEDRIDPTRKYYESEYQKEALLDFERTRKSMSVLSVHQGTGQRVLHVKGALESILARCTHLVTNDGRKYELRDDLKHQIEAFAHRYSEEGLRVLSFAYVEDPDYTADEIRNMDVDDYVKVENDMTFVGFAGMLDPPRLEVAESIRKCADAGIRVIVITGDNKATAEAICKEIGIFADENEVKGRSFRGTEFMQMSQGEQLKVLENASLFSRVEPTHKHHIVKLLREQQEVVAMTGDGVNDAPALKKADIGVAMGSGTAVASEASDMVLQDDNFATIVMAVEEGRAIYQNTKQFIRYLISSNIGEVFCILLTAAIGMPEALIPVQLLWVNLVTDGLPATALGFNRPDADIMKQAPRGRDDKIIDGWMFFRYFAIGVYIGVGTVFGFIWWYLFYENGPQISYAQLTNFHSCRTNLSLYPEGFDCTMFHDPRPSSVALSILVVIEMFNTFNALSENQSLLVTPPWDNIWVVLAVIMSMALHCLILYVPFFVGIFSTAPINTEEWTAVVMISFPVIVFDEGLKAITRAFSNAKKVKSKKLR